MSRLLLDTSVLVAAERGDGDLSTTIPRDADVAIAAVTLAELTVGIALASPRHRSVRAAFVADVRRTLPALAYDERVADAHAGLLAATRRSGRPRGAHDLLIAATAVAWDRTVVTRDGRAFAGLPGVTVITPA